jgi:hypothetical protein
MKRSLLIIPLILLSISMALNAQISLTATSGTASASYSTLGAAFVKINDGTHKGKITIMLTASTNEGNTAAILYGSGTGSSNYDSVRIYPTASGVTILGNRNAPMIDFDRADHVTIDGRVNATGLAADLVISNTNTSDEYKAVSTIRFVNGATNNTIKFCKIKGSTRDGTSGILCFFTSVGPSGNNNNTIEQNQITNAGGNLPNNAIFSNGSLNYPNSSNTIRNNNIYDVWNIRWTHTFSINLSANNEAGPAYNTGWTITGNSFYLESENIIPEYGSQNIHIIYINAQYGTDFTVSNNYIGGSAPLCGGTWTKTFGNNSFCGIGLNVATGTASNVQGNTIKNFSYKNGDYSWAAIMIGSGNVNVGTTAGNCIGGSSGTGSINIIADGYYWPRHYGIMCNSGGIVQIQNNIIGSITTNNLNPIFAASFFGVYINTNNIGSYSVSNNTIGSISTPNSINATSPSTDTYGNGIQMVAGILTEGNASNVPIIITNNTIANLTNGTTNTGPPNVQGWIYGIAVFRCTNTISGNSVHDLTIANSNEGTGPVPGGDWRNNSLSAAGIVVNSHHNVAQTASGNTVYNISNTYPTFQGHVAGVYFYGQPTASTIYKNLIYSLTAGSSSANIHGIKIGGGTATFSNNIITLEGSNPANLNGIYEAGTLGGISNIYFNTVYLGGSPSSGTLKSACIYNAGNSSTRNFRNNILFNARSNSGGSGKHYAMYIANAGGNLTCNYNDYYVNGTDGTLGYYGGDKISLPIASGVIGNDEQSLNLDPSFAIAGGPVANHYIPSTPLTAATETGIITDYGGIIRSVSSPEMGAWEQNNTITWNGNTSTDWDQESNWNSGTLPTASTNVIFPPGTANLCHVNMTVSSPALCNNLTIETGAVLTIDPGKALTVNGTLTNSAGNSGLVILSNENGTGSLIQGSSQVGATVQRFVTGSAALTNNFYHFVSIPVYYANPKSSLFLGSYLYKLDPTQVEPTNSDYYGKWVNLGTATTTSLSCLSGYMLYYPGTSNTYTFTGYLNTGTFSPAVSYGGTYTFNLVPNPYPSAINWGAAAGWSKSNIGATAWIWNRSIGNYTTLSGNSYIPAGQAFIVMASGSPVLTMNNSACLHNTQPFYKSDQANTLRISTRSNNYYDETFVGFDSSVGFGFDPQYDGFKMWGQEDAPQLWTEKETSRLSINRQPPPSGSLIVALDFKTSFSGQVILDVDGIESFDPSLALRLQDHLNGSMTDLRQNTRYVFDHNPANSEKRFSLIFGNPDGIISNASIEGKAFISNGRVYINIPSMQGHSAVITVYDMPGQLICSHETTIDGIISIESPLAKGIYIVRASSENRNFVIKVINK